MTTEPAVLIGAIGAIITAAIPLLARAFGWTEDVSREVETLLLAIVTLGGMLITALVIRSRVTPVASPNLPIGTVVNERSADATGTVTPKEV